MKPALEQIKQYTGLWQETNALYDGWAKRRGLSWNELLVLLSLSEADGVCRQKDICEQWLLSKQTVHSILKSLAARSLVILAPAEEDRRNKDILWTEAGEKFAKKITGDLKAQECAVWEKMGKKHAAALLESTALYNTLFQEVTTDEGL